MLDKISEYNVLYDSPGTSDRNAMPIGNGEIGLSVWVERDGDLQFYIARADAITELDRTVKLGKVKIGLSPNPFASGKPFLQELNLTEGWIKILAGEPGKQVSIKLFVSKIDQAIYVLGTSQEKVDVKVSYINWRTKYSKREEINGFIAEGPDKILPNLNGILFYHKNEENIINFTAGLQSLGDHLDKIPDLITGRIFGGILSLKGESIFDGDSALIKRHTNSFEVRVTTISEQIHNEFNFINKLSRAHRNLANSEKAFLATKDWWNAYWNKSWIFVEGDETIETKAEQKVINLASEKTYHLDSRLSSVTQAYILTKWMTACCSDGEFPIYYNGMLFNLMPGGNEHFSINNFGKGFTSVPSTEPDMNINPDERSWCIEHLWQNVRHPYLSMAARGESHTLVKLFRYYRRFWDINRQRAKIYYGAEGQHNTEMTLSFGLQSASIYGIDRTGKAVGYSENRSGGAVDISPGLELIILMFDYYKYSNDQEFLLNEILPYAKDLFLYVETRFTDRENGKILIEPLQCVETFWDTKNPVTVVVGLKSCLEEIFKLPKSLITDFEYFINFSNILPEITLTYENGIQVVSPAEDYDKIRHNIEPTELYTIFPFKHFTYTKPNYELAVNTYRNSIEKSGAFRSFVIGETVGRPSYSGWQYIGMAAAILRLADDAREVLVNNCSLKNPGHSFPAMWGPIYDAVPDTDHGANILNTLQLMTFQTDDNKIYILPAFPKEWNVSFKLFAPGDTTVECIYRNKKIEKLVVSPKERESDIGVCV
jgi:hypothetical protein